MTLAFLGALVGSASGLAVGKGLLQTVAVPRCCLLLSAESGFEARLRHFAPVTELPTVRGELARLQNQLQAAIDVEDFVTAAMVRDDIAELRSKDPAVASAMLREQLQTAVSAEDYEQASTLRDQLMILRRFLPQYQLAGLWKGALHAAVVLMRSLTAGPASLPTSVIVHVA